MGAAGTSGEDRGGRWTDPEDLDTPDVGAAPHARGAHGPRRTPGPARWPRGTPAWVRGPAGALASAGAAAVLAGAGTAAHVRAAGSAQQHDQVAQLSLQAGTVATSGAAQPVRSGRTAVDVVVHLVNRGPRSVTAAPVGLSAPGQRVVRSPAPVRIGPGTGVGVPLALSVDCARVPDAPASPGADGLPGLPPPSVAVRVGTSGGARTVEVPVLPEVSRSLGADLASACHPERRARLSTTWTYSADEHMRISVQDGDPAGSAPVLLGVQQTPGLTVGARPALLVVLAPGRTVQVDLSVEPDCAVVGDGTTSEVHLVQLDRDGAVVADLSTGGFDPRTQVVTGTTAWLARQIALRCR